MSWFDVIKIYMTIGEEKILPKEMFDLLQKLHSLEETYVYKKEELLEVDQELYDICEKMLEYVKDKNDKISRLSKDIKRHQNTSVDDEEYEDLYQSIISVYTELKDDEDDDGYTSPKRGNKNAQVVSLMDDFTDQYYENPFTDYKDSRELSAFKAGISNGESLEDLQNKYPFAHLVFDSAGLLSRVNE